ncbi:MAG: ADP-ribosylglycohydrolase family protein, partial [Gemmatimonadota bacterium]
MSRPAHHSVSVDRVRGVLIGTMIGDALGMPFEGMPRDAILARHGEPREMLEARLGRGTYTDDTQMALALAEALIDSPGRLDRDRVAARFAERYDPARGYGANTRRVLEAIRRGRPWREAAARHRPPGGSWANG